MIRIFDSRTQCIQVNFEKNVLVVKMGKKVVRRSFDQVPDIVLQPETPRFYGLGFRDHRPHIIANGRWFELVDNYRIHKSEHDWQQESLPVYIAGVEVETRDEYTTHFVFSILKGLGLEFELTSDGSADAEFKMTLWDWAEALQYIKPSLAFISTHIHFSNPSAFESFEWLTDHIDEIKPEIFGREFSQEYAYYTKRKIKNTSSRYAWVTFPDWGILPNGDIYINVENDNERATIEFRLPCITNLATLRNVLLIFKRNIEILKKVRNDGQVDLNQIKRLFDEIDAADSTKEVYIGRSQLRDVAINILENVSTPEARAFWVLKPYLDDPKHVACNIIIENLVEWR